MLPALPPAAYQHADLHMSCPDTFRYSAGYPAQPLQLRLKNAVGLLPADVRRLAHAVNESAFRYAKTHSVCVFNLVDECQNVLREENAAAEQRAAAVAAEQSVEAADSAPVAQSLWHAMQQRLQDQVQEPQDQLSASQPAAAAGGGLASLLGDESWMFDGGLFADEGAATTKLQQLVNSAETHRAVQGLLRPHHDGINCIFRMFAVFEMPGDLSALKHFVLPFSLHATDVVPGPWGVLLNALACAAGDLSFDIPTITSIDQQGGKPRRAGKGHATDTSPDASLPRSETHASQGAAPTMRDLEDVNGSPKHKDTGGLQLQSASSLEPPSPAHNGTDAAVGDLDDAKQQADEQQGPQQQQQKGQQQNSDMAQEQQQQQQRKHLAKSRTSASQHAMSVSGRPLSFSSLPKAMQALLNSRSEKQQNKSGRCRHKAMKQQQVLPATTTNDLAPVMTANAGADGLSSGSTATAGDADWLFASSTADAGRSSDDEGDGGSSSSSSSSSAADSDEDSEVGSSKYNQTEGTSSSSEEEEESSSLKSQLLLGHLLTVAASGAAGSVLPSHSLQHMASYLRHAGLMPKWVHWLLTKESPELFERAFRRIFAQVGYK